MVHTTLSKVIKQMNKVINFYSAQAEYGGFSNFSHHRVKVGNKIYKTSEHYFQSQKYAGTKHETDVINAKNAGKAAAIGRDRSRPLRRDWESVKDNVMRTVILAKFSQHIDLKEMLLGTGNANLVEHTEKDNYWADGGNGSGKNMLGIILMEVREKLKNDAISNV